MKKFALVNDELTEVEDESDFESEFQWALKLRNINLLERLLNKENCHYFITSNDSLNRNPFQIACEEGYYDIVELMLKNLGKIAVEINNSDNNQLTGNANGTS